MHEYTQANAYTPGGPAGLVHAARARFAENMFRAVLQCLEDGGGVFAKPAPPTRGSGETGTVLSSPTEGLAHGYMHTHTIHTCKHKCTAGCLS